MGDIHGCYDEFNKLFIKQFNYHKMKFIFVGDYTDRGPDNFKVIESLYYLKQQYPNRIFPLLGNHDHKLLRFLSGKKIVLHKDQKWYNTITDSQATLMKTFLSSLPSLLRIYTLEDPVSKTRKIINIAHGAIPESVYNMTDIDIDPNVIINKSITKEDATRCWYGYTTSKILESGFRERLHIPCKEKHMINIMGHIVHDTLYCIAKNEPGTSIYIDHGAVFGYRLSALVSDAIGNYGIETIPSKQYVKKNDPNQVLKIY